MPGYFTNFPQIYYDLSGEPTAAPVIVKNIFFRFKIRDAMLKKSLVYYAYSVKDSDTPEIIAHKYYKDVTKGWLVLMVNNMMDPQWDWVLNYDSFNNFIVAKYGSYSNASSTIHHYEMTITKIDGRTRISSSDTMTIDQTTYNSMAQMSTQVLNLNNGHDVTITTTTNAVDCLTWEQQRNDAKRNIRLLAADYISQIDREYAEIAKAKRI